MKLQLRAELLTAFCTEPARQVKLQTMCPQRSRPCAIKYFKHLPCLIMCTKLSCCLETTAVKLRHQLYSNPVEKLNQFRCGRSTWLSPYVSMQTSYLMFCIIELTLCADLIESLDHPLVPVAEHVQPLHLSLPEHFWRHILSSGDTTQTRQE